MTEADPLPIANGWVARWAARDVWRVLNRERERILRQSSKYGAVNVLRGCLRTSINQAWRVCGAGPRERAGAADLLK